MAMSRDRVKFYIQNGYYIIAGDADRLFDAMKKAFQISENEFERLTIKSGFWITCRPSQFARFLIYRDQNGLRNGFKDLKAELVPDYKFDVYQEAADNLDLSYDTVRAVLRFFNFDYRELEEKLQDKVTEVNVSDRPWKTE